MQSGIFTGKQSRLLIADESTGADGALSCTGTGSLGSCFPLALPLPRLSHKESGSDSWHGARFHSSLVFASSI